VEGDGQQEGEREQELEDAGQGEDQETYMQGVEQPQKKRQEACDNA
jgi:hypothetical protein